MVVLRTVSSFKDELETIGSGLSTLSICSSPPFGVYSGTLFSVEMSIDSKTSIGSVAISDNPERLRISVKSSATGFEIVTFWEIDFVGVLCFSLNTIVAVSPLGSFVKASFGINFSG